MDRPYLVVGSDPSCDLRLDHEGVEPRHCYLQWLEGHLFCCSIGQHASFYPRRDSQLSGRWIERAPIPIGPFQLTLISDEIQPEQTTEYEVGAELGFLKNRINFKVSVYHSDSRDQSLTQNLSSATGFTQQITNVGLVTNDGQELDLSVIPVKTSNWNWNLGINFSHYGNKVVSLGPGQTQLQLPGSGAIYAVVGLPYPVIKTNDFNRDPQGRVIVDATTGLPSVNSQLTTYGNTNPTHILGVTSSLTYKSWNLSFVIDYRGGNQVFNTIAATEAFTGISSQSAQNGRQRFIFPNSVINTGTASNPVYTANTTVAVNNGGDVEGSGFWPTIFSSPLGSIFVDDASFIKLREATFTYTVPPGFLAKNAKYIKKASIGLVGRNLLMFRPKSNTFTDPEFSDAGSGNATGTTSVNQTPPTRFYGANLTLTF